MKRLMMIAWMAAAAGLVAAEAAPKQHLVAAAYVAPFTEITQTATALGTMFNQPLMPAVAMAAAQQSLAKEYGPINAAEPAYALVYVDTAKVAALDLEGGTPDVDGIADVALLYPVSGGENALMTANAGAQKDSSGVIKLAGKKKPFKYAKFTADGKFCAFAKSAALAARAGGDVARAKDWLKSPKPALTRLYLNSRGIDAVAVFCEKMYKAQEKGLNSEGVDATLASSLRAVQAYQRKSVMKTLRSLGNVKVALGFDDRGLAIWGGASLRKGAAPFLPAGTAMAGKALDQIPAGAGFTLAQNTLASMQGGDVSEGVEVISGLIASLRDMLKKSDNKNLAKYKQTLDDLMVAVLDMYASFKDVKIVPSDWASFSLAFDAQKRPAILARGQGDKSPAVNAAPGKCLDRIIAILERQWPANGVMKKLADGKYTFDWACLVDLLVKECDADADDEDKTDPKEIAEVKSGIAKVLGGTVTGISFKFGAEDFAKIAVPEVSIAPAPAGQSAQRLFAAVPEADKDAMLGYFYTTPYAFVRDIGMPIYLKFVGTEEAQQYNAILTALPKAAPGGAFAGASWLRKDGAIKFAMRLTADEIKTIGAAVTALGGSGDDEDDDE